MPSRCSLLVALWLAVGLGACTSPGSQRIVGPDGSPMAHVHCGSDQGVCFRIAGELCPSGYDIKPVLSGSDGNFLVRCRAPRALAQLESSCPLPAAPASTAAGLMYPWPPPGSDAARSAPPISRSPSGELDLGY